MTLHQPVMLNEVLEWLAPRQNGRYVDGTFGRGGYSRAMLERGAVVYAFDRDAEAIAAGQSLAVEHPGRLHLIHACFGDMQPELAARNVSDVDGVVLDLGVSSPQLDTADRGFSFQHDGPLDMRMGQSGASAADLVNTGKEEELSAIIFNYGEEKLARRVARAIVKARTEGGAITRTQQLAAIIRAVVPPSRDGIDPATRTFQALRIAVNDELGELERGLAAAHGLLKDGGRLVVVSFHSLEDRIVKNFMRNHSGKAPPLSRHLPAANSNVATTLRVLTPKPIPAGEEESRANPRAASAKLRAAERIFSDISTESLDVNPGTVRK